MAWDEIFTGYCEGAVEAREALALDPVRVRHGVRAAEDPALLAKIVGRGVVLDVCPTSNLRTGLAPDAAGHPLPRLRAAGALCSVSMDDPAMFGTDLGQEYALAARVGHTPRDAYAAGLAGALCGEPERALLADGAP